MIGFITRVAFLIVLALTANLARAAQPPSISLDVTVEQVTDHVETWRSTFGYWVEREARNARVGAADVFLKGDKPLPVRVEFYFIGQRVNDRSAGLELYHFHRKDVTVQPQRSTRVATISKTIVNENAR